MPAKCERPPNQSQSNESWSKPTPPIPRRHQTVPNAANPRSSARVSWEGTSSTCNLEKAVLFKDRSHLLEGREFLKVLRELERLNTEALLLEQAVRSLSRRLRRQWRLLRD